MSGGNERVCGLSGGWSGGEITCQCELQCVINFYLGIFIHARNCTNLSMYILKPLNKGHFGTSTKLKHLSFIERLSFVRRLYLLSFM